MKNEKKPASAQTAPRREEMYQQYYFTTDRGAFQGKIAALLPRGEVNAVSTADLMALAGFRTARQLQKQIETERAAGALILSASTGGYYLPQLGEAGRAELIRYERTLRSRAIHTLRTLKTARRALRELDGQLEMGVPE